MTDTDQELLTISQVAGRLNIRERILQPYVDSGALRSIKIGKQVRYRWRDVDAWLEEISTTHPATLTVGQPVAKKIPTVPQDTSTPTLALVRGPKGRNHVRVTGESSL